MKLLVPQARNTGFFSIPDHSKNCEAIPISDRLVRA